MDDDQSLRWTKKRCKQALRYEAPQQGRLHGIVSGEAFPQSGIKSWRGDTDKPL
jgi:hypothetical protein